MALWHSFNTTIPIDVELSTTAIEPYYDEVRGRIRDIGLTLTPAPNLTLTRTLT